MNNFVNDLIERLNRQEQLVANTQYIDWLYEFTNSSSRSRFNDIDWLYEEDPSISSEDYEKINLLTGFFAAIDNYHRKNLLDANAEGYSAWYNIKYKDAYFAIGICVGQGAYNFVTRYESCEEMGRELYIEFDYIMHNKIAPGFEQKQAKLQQLEQLIDEMINIRVPKEAVDKVIKNVFGKKK